MFKTIVKEFIILLLLLLAILLLLGVFLYDYIPTNKVVPKIEPYQVSNSVKKELEESINDIDEQTTQIVYEIDGTDLNNYEKTKDYQKGKVNPFADISQPSSGQSNGNNSNAGNTNTDTNNNANNSNNNNDNNDNNNNSNSNNDDNSNQNTNSEGSYLPNKGTK